jgi:hypothetical protein
MLPQRNIPQIYFNPPHLRLGPPPKLLSYLLRGLPLTHALCRAINPQSFFEEKLAPRLGRVKRLMMLPFLSLGDVADEHWRGLPQHAFVREAACAGRCRKGDANKRNATARIHLAVLSRWWTDERGKGTIWNEHSLCVLFGRKRSSFALDIFYK